jgi:hypothetical protein
MFSSLGFTKPPVQFETNLALRSYVLNRPKKLNALDESMITLLRKQVEVRHRQGSVYSHSIDFTLRNGVSPPLLGQSLAQESGARFALEVMLPVSHILCELSRLS